MGARLAWAPMPQPAPTSRHRPTQLVPPDDDWLVVPLILAAVCVAITGMVATLAGLVADHEPDVHRGVGNPERVPLPSEATGHEHQPDASDSASAMSSDTPVPLVGPAPEAIVSMEAPPTTPPAPPTTTTTTTPPPTVAPPPPPTDVATTTPDPGTGDLHARAVAALHIAVPDRWLTATPATIEIISGFTSWSRTGGRMQIGRRQVDDSWDHALYVLAHEWAHQAAYRFGSGAYLGAPPSGFPTRGTLRPAEMWAECVAQSFLGFRWDSWYPHCPPASRQWTDDWLAAGPPD